MEEERIHPAQAMVDAMNARRQRMRSQTQMTLGALIALLKTIDPERSIVGLGTPHSYRGYYSDLSFQPIKEATTVANALEVALRCMGVTFEGWKGGDFMMGDSTPIWSAAIGEGGGDRIMGVNTEVEPMVLILKKED